MFTVLYCFYKLSNDRVTTTTTNTVAQMFRPQLADFINFFFICLERECTLKPQVLSALHKLNIERLGAQGICTRANGTHCTVRQQCSCVCLLYAMFATKVANDNDMKDAQGGK